MLKSIAGLESGEDRPGDERVAVQEVGHLRRVLGVLADAQRQGFEPLDEQEGVLRRHRRADVAQELDPRAQREGNRAERLRRLGPDRTMIGGVGLGQQREAVGMGLPVESAAVDDGAADRGAVAADVFRGGVDDHRGAMLERPGEERRGGIVEDERHAEPAPQRRDLGDREDFQLRVRQRLAEPGAGAVVGGPGEVLRVVMADEADLDPELLQRLGQEGHRAAIEIGRGDDVVAGPGDVGERDEGRRLPRGERQRRGAAFERGEPFLEDVLGRVLDAGIDLSDLLQGEEAGSVGGVLELERGVLVDRHRHRAGGRVRPPAAAGEREGFGVKAGRGHVPGSLSCGCLRMAGKSRP